MLESTRCRGKIVSKVDLPVDKLLLLLYEHTTRQNYMEEVGHRDSA